MFLNHPELELKQPAHLFPCNAVVREGSVPSNHPERR